MIVRYNKISKLHNIFPNIYIIGKIVMQTFSVFIEIKKLHIYLFGTLSLMKWGPVCETKTFHTKGF